MTPRNVLRAGCAVALTVVGCVAATGTAYAFWAAAGSGSGTATATSAQSLTTSTATTGGTQLYPGGTGDLRLIVNNPNPFPVTVSKVTGTGTIISNQGVTCDAATGVTFTDVVGASLVVPAASTRTFTLIGAVAMDNSSDTSCQGATFTIPVTLTGASS